MTVKLGPPHLTQIDDFTAGYIECALWSSTKDDGSPMDDDYGINDLSGDTLARMIEDCTNFQEANQELLDSVIERESGSHFWLTRNGHGAGFWDRGYGEVGTKLTDAAHVYGSVDLYVGSDGQVYAQ